jgi:hypothetical protein
VYESRSFSVFIPGVVDQNNRFLHIRRRCCDIRDRSQCRVTALIKAAAFDAINQNPESALIMTAWRAAYVSDGFFSAEEIFGDVTRRFLKY